MNLDRFFKCLLPLIIAAVVFLPSGRAEADGKVFHNNQARVNIPDQRALIHFDYGTETLVIETHFNGKGEEFAWVVPLPSPPEIKDVSPGVFKTLHSIFQPKLIIKVEDMGSFFVLLTFCLIVCVVASPTPVRSFLKACFIVGIIIIIASIAAPNSLSTPSSMEGISILKRQNIGAYKTVTLKADNSSVLSDWLKHNKFNVPDGLNKATDYYIKKNWVFVAAKLRSLKAGEGTQATSPLAFIFKTTSAVYPMRMTAVDGGRCKVDLYVFGEKRARANKFSVEYCQKPEYPEIKDKYDDIRYLYRTQRLRILHKGLKSLVSHVEDARVATKLTAELAPRDMMEDVEIEWEKYKPYWKQLYTEGAAFMEGLNIFSVVGFFGLLVIFIFAGFFRQNIRLPGGREIRIPVKVAIPLILVLAVICIGGTYLCKSGFETVEVTESTRPEMTNREIHQQCEDVIHEVKTLPEMRKALAEYFKDKKNVFTGGEIIEEDSPGNYILKEINGKLVYFWFTGEGHGIPLNPPDQSDSSRDDSSE